MTSIDKSDSPKICVIGAGFSGIAAGVKLKLDLGITDYTIYDENEDVGGTWLVNTYPGCACDVASHLYSYSFEPNPNWTQSYSPQPEIWNYMKHVATKYDLYPNIKFNHHVKSLTWDEKISKWRVVAYDKANNAESEFIFDVVLSGVGALRAPHTPEEFLAFKGSRVHSAEWDSSLKLEDKTVAVVGSGASAVQIVPTIAKKVKKLIVYQRHPAWVMPKMQFTVPDWMKWAFLNFPGSMQFFRSFIFFYNEMKFPAFQAGSYAQKFGSWFADRQLEKQLGGRPDLMEKLRPNYQWGCKRITPANEYYPSLALPHVEVIRDPITKVKQNSIVTANGEEEIDVLILATGFKVQDFFSPLVITGKGGVDMLKLWQEQGPSAYLGTCTSILPNMFFLLGPNTGLGHNSIIFTIECQVDWALQAISEMMKRDAKIVQVKRFAELQYMNRMLGSMKSTVWATGCDSWYADKRGVVTVLSPYSLISYWYQTRKLDTNHLEFY